MERVSHLPSRFNTLKRDRQTAGHAGNREVILCHYVSACLYLATHKNKNENKEQHTSIVAQVTLAISEYGEQTDGQRVKCLYYVMPSSQHLLKAQNKSE